MPEMVAYCGTIKRVMKTMNRFVDEHDLRVKKTTRIMCYVRGLYVKALPISAVDIVSAFITGEKNDRQS